MDLRKDYENEKPNLQTPEDYIRFIAGITRTEYAFIRNFFNMYSYEIIYLRLITSFDYKKNEEPKSLSEFYRESSSTNYYFFSKLKAVVRQNVNPSDLTHFGINEKRDLIISIMTEDFKKLKWTINYDTVNNVFRIYYPQPQDLIILPPFTLLDKQTLSEIDSEFLNYAQFNPDFIRNLKLYVSFIKLTKPVYMITDIKLSETISDKFAPPMLITLFANLVPIDENNPKLIRVLFTENDL